MEEAVEDALRDLLEEFELDRVELFFEEFFDRAEQLVTARGSQYVLFP